MMVASFNLLPTDQLFDKYVELTPTEPQSANFESLGYETRNLLKNLGLLFFLFALHLIMFLIFSILHRCRSKGPNYEALYKWVRKHAIGTVFIRFFMESYLEVAVSVFLNFRMISEGSPGEIFSSVINVCLAIALVCVPLLHFGFMYRNIEHLEHKDFKAEYGTIYEDLDLKLDQKSALAYTAVYMFRRLMMTVIAICVPQPAIQLILFAYLQTAVVVYIGNENPLRTIQLNRHEKVNEGVISFLLLHMFCLTNFVTEADTRFTVGYSFCFTFLFYLAANLIILAVQSVRNCR